MELKGKTLIKEGTPSPSRVSSPAAIRRSNLPFAGPLALDIENLCNEQNRQHRILASVAPTVELPVPLNVFTVVASERSGSRVLGADTLTRWGLEVVVTLPGSPRAGQWVNFELSFDDGVTWQYVSRQLITSSVQTFSDVTNPGAPYSEFQRFVPNDDSNCKVRVYPGTGGADASPADATESATFVVLGIGDSTASDITDAHVVVQPDGRLYKTTQDAQGHWLWGADLSFTTADVDNLYYFIWTAKHVDALGNVDPVYGEVEGNAGQGANITQIDKSGVNWAIPLPTDPYPGVRYQVYAASRHEPIVRILQTHCWPGGLDYEDVFPVAPTGQPTSVVAQERASSRQLGTDTLTRWGLQVVVTLPAAPVANEWCNFELSMDNGASYQYVSRQPITTTPQTYTDLTNPGTPYSDFQRFAPQADSTCKVRAWVGTGGASTTPTGVVVSAAFTVNKVGNAPANALSAVSLSAMKEDNKSGVQCMGYDVTMTAGTAPNAYSFRWTVEHVDVAGNVDPAYGRVNGNESLIANGGSATDVSDVNWGFPPPGATYTGLRYRAQALSRQLPLTWVDQTGCFGGAAYLDKFPTSSGGKMITWSATLGGVTNTYKMDPTVGLQGTSSAGGGTFSSVFSSGSAYFTYSGSGGTWHANYSTTGGDVENETAGSSFDWTPSSLTLTVASVVVFLANVDGVATGSAWNGPHLILGAFHLWIDATGDLRIKSGAPTSATDGTVVGTQS